MLQVNALLLVPLNLSIKQPLRFFVLFCPNNQDPMEFLTESGAEKPSILDSARPLMDFVFDATTAQFDLSVLGGRSQALEALASC